MMMFVCRTHYREQVRWGTFSVLALRLLSLLSPVRNGPLSQDPRAKDLLPRQAWDGRKTTTLNMGPFLQESSVYFSGKFELPGGSEKARSLKPAWTLGAKNGTF
jgi:hypothetical protein